MTITQQGPASLHPASAALFDTDDSDKTPAKSGLSALAGNITGIFAKSKSGEGAAGGDGVDAADADDDEDGTSAERFELKAPENPPSIKKGPYRIYVHLHEARDMRSSNDPAKRHKFPEPVFTVRTCGKKEHTKRKKKCQACLLNQLFVFDFEQKDSCVAPRSRSENM
jgi:hypothetical protein